MCAMAQVCLSLTKRHVVCENRLRGITTAFFQTTDSPFQVAGFITLYIQIQKEKKHALYPENVAKSASNNARGLLRAQNTRQFHPTSTIGPKQSQTIPNNTTSPQPSIGLVFIRLTSPTLLQRPSHSSPQPHRHRHSRTPS